MVGSRRKRTEQAKRRLSPLRGQSYLNRLKLVYVGGTAAAGGFGSDLPPKFFLLVQTELLRLICIFLSRTP